MSDRTWKQPIPRAVFHDMSSSVAMRPKSASSPPAARWGAGAAKCDPAGEAGAPASWAPTRSRILLARHVSMTMNAMPYTMSIAATT